MAYPEYIQTRVISVGGATALESSTLLKIQVAIVASRSLIWDATGYRFEKTGHSVESELGNEVQIVLPRTDVAGWKDAATGSIIDVSAEDAYSHRYTATVRFLDANNSVVGAEYTIGPFPIPDGEGAIDLDRMVPASTVAGDAISIPDLWGQLVAQAETAAASAQAALVDSAQFVADEIGTPGTPARIQLEGTIDAGVDFARGKPAAPADAAVEAVPQLRTLALGDSIAYFKWRYIFAQLDRAYGGAGHGAPGVAIETGQNGTGWSIPGVSNNAGDSTAASDDFDAWFSGRTHLFTSGQYREFGRGSVAATWDTAKVYYVTGPTAADAGTFKIAVDGVDATGYEDIDTTAAEQGLGIATITYGSAEQRTFRVTNLTGNTRIVGVAFLDSTAPGAARAGIAQGGISLTQALTPGAISALETFVEDYQPHIITLEMKETSAEFATNLAVLLPLLRQSAPTAMIVGIGSTPVASNNADQLTQNAQLRAACAASGCMYWDGYAPVVDYATLDALGWAGDGIHVADGASAFLGGLMAEELGLYAHPALDNPRNVNAELVRADKIGIGESDPTAPLEIESSTWARMVVRAALTTGQTAGIDLISGFSGVFGDAKIVADSARLRVMGPTVGGSANAGVTVEAYGAEVARFLSGLIRLNSGPEIHSGAGNPEGSKSAPVGSIYLRTGGGAATSFYVKESGTGNTGWVAK